MTVSVALLQLFDPFEELDDEQLGYMAESAQISRYPKGVFLTKRGKEVDTVAFLISGQVDLVDGNFNSESVNGSGERRSHPLVDTSPSPVSVMAKSDVELLVIDMDAYHTALAWKEEGKTGRVRAEVPREEGSDWMMTLLHSPLFAQIPPTQIQQLFNRFEAIEVKAGEMVVREGATGDYFYVLERGTAVVQSRFTGDIAELRSGNFFGEEALVGETTRNASVVMSSPGVLMRLSKDDFKSLLMEPLIRYIEGDQFRSQKEEGNQLQLVDIRLPVEYRKMHVKDSVNIPLSQLRDKLDSLDQQVAYLIIDDGGKRSEVAAHILCQAGFNAYILLHAYREYPLDKLA